MRTNILLRLSHIILLTIQVPSQPLNTLSQISSSSTRKTPYLTTSTVFGRYSLSLSSLIKNHHFQLATNNIKHHRIE